MIAAVPNASPTMSRDARIDAYIARAAPFARPMLEHLRTRVHAACPAAEESIKWGMPHFLYRGEILCGMAAFKGHASFGFWRGTQVTGEGGDAGEAMGQFGRLTSLADLPDDAALDALIDKAKALIDSGAKAPTARKPRPALDMPDDFRVALDANPQAARQFEDFAPSKRRDYIEWVVEAKRAETRQKRIAQSVDWIAEGKARHWKYEGC